MEAVLLAIYAVAVGVSAFYYLFFYLRFGLYRSELDDVTPDPVSVIIAARNEADNLSDHLPVILGQRGVDFEVIVVDDRSEDETPRVLNEIKDDRLKVVRISSSQDGGRGKKMAITLGIKKATHENLVFIDADCVPASANWLLYMASGLMRRPVVIGVSPFKPGRGFWKRFFAFDAFVIAVQYVSFALAGVPYMGVGRNMGYRKKLFYEHSGFKGHMHLDSGDDDLFINRAVRKNNVEVVLHPDAFTVSESEDSLKKWINQKIRHVSTAPGYRVKHKILLILLPISQYIVFGLFVVLLWLNANVILIAALFILRVLTQQIVFSVCLARIKALSLWPTGITYELTQLFVYPVVIAKRMSRRIELWKRT